jgi:hypothetical protein
VRRTSVSKNIFGECILISSRGRKEFLIKIDRNLDEETAVFVLLHETAHCDSWNKEKNDHGLEFGKAYSKIYRYYLKNWIEK